jgi:hypothetical protein
MGRIQLVLGALSLVGIASSAAANNVGENYAWQFPTTADKLNQALILDIIEKKRSGYYAPPTYITNIDRQYNCNVSATATGNEGTNTNLANAPSTSGNASDATGNDNESHIDGWKGDSDITTGQDNDGHVHSVARGNIHSHVEGSPEQALNSEQTNTGNQTATVDGSTACNFANVLN